MRSYNTENQISRTLYKIKEHPLVSATVALLIILFVLNSQQIISPVIDWGIFLLASYVVIGTSWTIAKKIDAIDLRSDLSCWGLRIIALPVIFFGVMLLASTSLVFTFSRNNLVFNNIYWILGVCIILLGLFMEYRSFRRHPALMIWG